MMKKFIVSFLSIIMILQNLSFAAEENADPFADRDELNIAFIGGSITEGYGSTTWSSDDLNDAEKDGSIKNTNCYAGLVGQWFIDKYPNKKVNVYNAGYSGTTSELGVFRLKNEVFKYNPDMIFVEFAVNDRWNIELSKKCMEAIVRLSLQQEKVPVINFIYTTMEGYQAIGAYQEEVAEYYGIPSHDLQTYVKGQISKGKYVFEKLFPDLTHPSDEGYKVYADFIIDNLEKSDYSYFVKPTYREKAKFGADYKSPTYESVLKSQRVGSWSTSELRGLDVISTVQKGAKLTYKFYGDRIGLRMNYSAANEKPGDVSYAIDGVVTSSNGIWIGTELNLTQDWHTLEITYNKTDGGLAEYSIYGFYVDNYGAPETGEDGEGDVEINVTEGVTEIFVSTEGNDANDGSIEKPLRTITQGLKAASKLSKNSTTDITVNVRQGAYYEPNGGISLDKEISGTENSRIVVKAYNDEKVSVTGGTSIDSSYFKKVTDEATLKRIPKNAHGYVYYANLKAAGISDWGVMAYFGYGAKEDRTRQLTIDGQEYEIARWPNAGYTYAGKKIETTIGTKFTYENERMKRWQTATEAWAYGYWKWKWADQCFRISEIDWAKKTISTLDSHYFGFAEGASFYVYNLIEELDAPGEWFLDSLTGNLYLYPKNNIDGADIQLSTPNKPLLEINESEYITFYGITFENGINDAITITDGRHILVDNCEIKNVGGMGFETLGTNSKNCGVRNTYIYRTGDTAVNLQAGDFKTLEYADGFAEHCRIEQPATKSGVAYGAVISGVGNRISHCEINNAKKQAIAFGRSYDSIIEYNEIYNTLKYANDAGAIYGGRDWTSGNTVIRYNYIHHNNGADLRTDDIWSTQSIYADDGFAGCQIYGNVIEGSRRGIFFHYANNALIENNLFIDCDEPICFKNRNGNEEPEWIRSESEKIGREFDAGNLEIIKDEVGDGTYFMWTERYMLNPTLYEEKMPWLKTVMYRGVEPVDNIIRKNISVSEPVEEFSIYKSDKDKIILYPENVEGDNVIENNYRTDTFTSYEELASHIEGFDVVDLAEVGPNSPKRGAVGEFNTIWPPNGAIDIDNQEVVLSWEASSGASNYWLTVAEDPEFKNIVLYEENIDNYRVLPALKSGAQTYYWKVEAFGVNLKNDKTLVPNSNGVQFFRTSNSTKLNKDELLEAIEEAKKAEADAVEGTEKGMFAVGSKAILRGWIEASEDIYKNTRKALSPYISLQTTIDDAAEEMKKRTNIFMNSKVIQDVDLGDEVFTGSADWSHKDVMVSKREISFSANGYTAGFKKNKIDPFKKLKFKVKFDLAEGAWSAIVQRAADPTSVIYGIPGYCLLIKEDTVELQRFGAGGWLKEAPNEYLKPGAWHDVEFGVVNEGSIVRISVISDGHEVFNVLDESNPIMDGGYFTMYNSGKNTITLQPAE